MDYQNLLTALLAFPCTWILPLSLSLFPKQEWTQKQTLLHKTPSFLQVPVLPLPFIGIHVSEPCFFCKAIIYNSWSSQIFCLICSSSVHPRSHMNKWRWVKPLKNGGVKENLECLGSPNRIFKSLQVIISDYKSSHRWTRLPDKIFLSFGLLSHPGFSSPETK